MEVERILQEELVDSRAARVSLTAFGNAIFAISLRVNVVATAREQDSMCSMKQSRNAILTLVKRDENGGDAGGMKRGEIGRQRTLVVG